MIDVHSKLSIWKMLWSIALDEIFVFIFTYTDKNTNGDIECFL